MIGLMYGNFIFDVVLTVLCIMLKIVASFYKLQYERIKRGMVGCVYVFVLNSLWYVSDKNWQNWMISDQVIINIKGWVF